MRLPTKPKQLPTTTHTLRMALVTLATAAMASGAVSLPLTSSTSFIMCAGEKKCIPSTRAGRAVAVAISSMESVEVLDARMACGWQIWSRRAKTSVARAMFGVCGRKSVGWVRLCGLDNRRGEKTP